MPEELRLPERLLLRDHDAATLNSTIGIQLDYLHVLYLLYFRSSQFTDIDTMSLKIACDILSLVNGAMGPLTQRQSTMAALRWKESILLLSVVARPDEWQLSFHGLSAAAGLCLVLLYMYPAAELKSTIADSLNDLARGILLGGCVEPQHLEYVLLERAAQAIQSVIHWVYPDKFRKPQLEPMLEAKLDWDVFSLSHTREHELYFWTQLAHHPGLSVPFEM